MILFNKSHTDLVGLYNTNITIEPRKAYEIQVKNEKQFEKEIQDYLHLKIVEEEYCIANNIEIVNRQKEMELPKENKESSKLDENNENVNLEVIPENIELTEDNKIEITEEETEDKSNEINEINEIISNRKKRKNK